MEVRKKIYKKIAIRGIILLLVALAFVAIYFFHLPIISITKYKFMVIPVTVAVYIYIVYKLKFIHMLFDKEWEGTVISSTSYIGYEPITFGVAISRRPPKKIMYTLLLVSIDGIKKTKKIRIPSKIIDPTFFSSGDRLKHFKGAKYPQNLDRKDEIFICPVCGKSCYYENFCPDCKIKF